MDTYVAPGARGTYVSSMLYSREVRGSFGYTRFRGTDGGLKFILKAEEHGAKRCDVGGLAKMRVPSVCTYDREDLTARRAGIFAGIPIHRLEYFICRNSFVR